MLKEKIERHLLEVQKPGRYTGGELGSVWKDKNGVKVRFAFCFPDTYEVGMSHLGMKILYGLMNQRDDIWCERVFAPWEDMEKVMRREEIPLYGLESFDPLSEFDIIGFTLQYELSFTNILNMLDLAGIPVLAKERKGLTPIIMAGGPCACNPEPLADFFDLFVLGEGEEADLAVIDLYEKAKEEGWSKERFLEEVAQIRGVYVPSLYEVTYLPDGRVEAITPTKGAPARVKKCVIEDLDKVYYPDTFVVPFLEIVHDRAMVEVMRGCIRGCRFCQAGFIYRPLREKSHATLAKDAQCLCGSTGYDEISLSSLSTSDYSQIEPLLNDLVPWSDKEHINLSLPSLRVDNFSKELMDKVTAVRKSSLTFAPEAGTQRLRDAINKNVTEGEIMRTCRTAFEGGYTNVKLYFMLGLPTETMEDIEGIAETAQKVVDLYYSLPTKPKGKGVNVTISVACFIPKPFTPFEFEPQDTEEMLVEKQKHLVESVRSRKITVHYHDSKTSFLEGVLARGDRKLGQVIYKAWKAGCVFDSWTEFFHMDKWLKAMEECGLDPAFYANRRREYDEVMPWSHLDYLVSRKFFIEENKKAWQSVTTPNCREKCSACGAAVCKGGVCFE